MRPVSSPRVVGRSPTGVALTGLRSNVLTEIDVVHKVIVSRPLLPAFAGGTGGTAWAWLIAFAS
jgi:hypothetical protein